MTLSPEEMLMEHEGTYEEFIERVCGGSKQAYRKLAQLRAGELAGECESGVDAGVLGGARTRKNNGRSLGATAQKSTANAVCAKNHCGLHAETLGETKNPAVAA